VPAPAAAIVRGFDEGVLRGAFRVRRLSGIVGSAAVGAGCFRRGAPRPANARSSKSY